MLILLDTNIPRGLVRALAGHTVVESRERGWAELTNGDLLNAGNPAPGVDQGALVTRSPDAA